MTESAKMFYAHSANSIDKWHPLSEHLASVSHLAATFSGATSWEDEARLAGSLHDLGKYGDRFQARLHGEDQGLDHWTQGASVALVKFRAVAAALALQVSASHMFLAAVVMYEKSVFKTESAAAVSAASTPATAATAPGLWTIANGTLAHIKILLKITMALGVVIAGLGFALMGYTHDLITSGIIAAIGAVIAIYSYISLPDLTGTTETQMEAQMTAANAIPAVSGLMLSAGGAMSTQSLHSKIYMD